MYNNSGEKIKNLAIAFCVTDVVATIIISTLLGVKADEAYNGEVLTILATVTLIVGAIVAWLGYLLLAGFGELVQNSTDIAEMMRSQQSGSNNKKKRETKSVSVDEKSNNGFYLEFTRVVDGYRCSKCGETRRVWEYKRSDGEGYLFFCANCIEDVKKTYNIQVKD